MVGVLYQNQVSRLWEKNKVSFLYEEPGVLQIVGRAWSSICGTRCWDNSLESCPHSRKPLHILLHPQEIKFGNTENYFYVSSCS
jgi:hypothetical protein